MQQILLAAGYQNNLRVIKKNSKECKLTRLEIQDKKHSPNIYKAASCLALSLKTDRSSAITGDHLLRLPKNFLTVFNHSFFYLTFSQKIFERLKQNCNYLMKASMTIVTRLRIHPAWSKAFGIVSAPVPTIRLKTYISPT